MTRRTSLLGQSRSIEKKPKVSAKTVAVPFLCARNIYRRAEIILSRTQRDKTVLSPGQDFFPGTKLFCPRDKILSPGQDAMWVWVFQVELTMHRNCIISQFDEFGSQYSLAILVGETAIDVGTVCDSI
jgi:hypothetical protein